MVPFVLLLIPFIAEGIGLRIPRQTILLAYFFIPSILLILHILKNRTITLPSRATFLAVLSLIGANIAFFFFSLDKQTSFEHFLYFLSLFLIFIYSYNHREEAQGNLFLFIGILSTLFTLYSRLVPLFVTYRVQALIPFAEKQLVFPTYMPHNHLGDFLGMLLVLLAVRHRGENAFLLLLAFMGGFVFFIASASRSAYLAFFFVLILYLIRSYRTISRRYLYIGAASLGIIMVVSFLTLLPYAVPSSPVTKVMSNVGKYISFAPRGFLSNRDIYYRQALSSIRERPLGIGAGNFRLASYKYSTDNEVSDSAHSLFLEQAAENGIPFAIILILLTVVFIVSALKSPSPAGFIFIYLILNFQTDYTYQIYLFPVLAVIAAAASYREKNELVLPSVSFLGASLLLPLIAVSIIVSSYFVTLGNYDAALSFYPLNKEAYIWLIMKTKGDDEIVRKGLSVAPYDQGILYVAAATYYKNGQKQKALPLYEAAYGTNHLLNFRMASQLYLLKKELRSKKEAFDYLYSLFSTYNHMNTSDAFVKEIAAFCARIGKEECKRAGWDK